MLCPSCFQEKGDTLQCAYCPFVEEESRNASLLPYRHGLQNGRYVIGRVLGTPGGFGVAYKALDRKGGAIVVVKENLITASNQIERVAGDPWVHVNSGFEAKYRQWLRRFRGEAEIIGKIKSPYIVRVTDVFEEHNTGYYIMPFVEGDDLGAYCAARGGSLLEAEVMQIALELLEGLKQVHAKGIVHRDISPSNVLMTLKRPVLIDFGAAREHFDDEQSRSHMRVHKPNYAPFEQVHGLSTQGPWTDIYSLCATLHFCLLGEPPPRATDRSDILVPKRDPFVPIHERLPNLGPELATLINNGLAIRPKMRPKDAAAAMELLRPTRSSDEVTPTVIVPPPAPAPAPASLPDPTSSGTVPPAKPAPPPAFLGLVPAILLVWWGFQGANFDEHGSLIGTLVVANLIVWVVWLAVRKRRASSTNVSGPTIVPSQIDTPMPTVSQLELILRTPDAPPLRRTLSPGDAVVVGRNPNAADIVVANDRLSARHLRVVATAGGEFELEDLGSTNFTYVHDRRANGGAGAWTRIKIASGRRGLFMLGPPDNSGVVLEIQQAIPEP